ncbi:MAG: lipopolysaccharide heptosyltransferase I [Betaproteobacteria bacterium]|nr:lipopolysaccharide heptosyltransferase I [Betaproteobacteria bacterium]
MRRILVIKTSSLGDVVHALPAVSDMAQHFPDAAIDWMVEESFRAIPELHPAVRRVLPVATRRWRKALCARQTWQDLRVLRHQLTEDPYDLAIDFQGLMKSALLGLLVPTHRVGYTWASAREPLATLAYQEKFAVPWSLHAVERNRQLAAQALGYAAGPDLSYGLRPPTAAPDCAPAEPYAVLLHATSRPHKEWPEDHWIRLGLALEKRGLRSVIPGGSPLERARSQRLASHIPGALAPAALGLHEVAGLLGHARVVVGVDTGLAHLAVALGRPVVAIFTATRPEDTGVYGSPLAINCGGRKQVPSVETILQVLPC